MPHRAQEAFGFEDGRRWRWRLRPPAGERTETGAARLERAVKGRRLHRTLRRFTVPAGIDGGAADAVRAFPGAERDVAPGIEIFNRVN